MAVVAVVGVSIVVIVGVAMFVVAGVTVAVLVIVVVVFVFVVHIQILLSLPFRCSRLDVPFPQIDVHGVGIRIVVPEFGPVESDGVQRFGRLLTVCRIVGHDKGPVNGVYRPASAPDVPRTTRVALWIIISDSDGVSRTKRRFDRVAIELRVLLVLG